MNSTTKNKAINIKSLMDSEVRYRRLFEAAQDGILILDAKTGMIDDVNPYLIKMLKYSRNEFLEKKLWEVGSFKDVKASRVAFQALQKENYIRYKDLPLRAKNGELIQVEFVSNVYWEGDKKVIQCNIRNITERKRKHDALLKSKAVLREQTVRDHLTGLFNRRYLELSLKRELQQAAHQHTSLGLIMFDLDNFKLLNDTCGHAAGDAVLQGLGSLILEHIRNGDVPSRYGGDEFVIIVPEASRVVTQTRAELICEKAGNLSLLIEGGVVPSVMLSSGIASYPEDGSTTAALLKAADDQLYRAKREKHNNISVEVHKSYYWDIPTSYTNPSDKQE